MTTYSPLQRQLLLRAYLLAVDSVPPPIAYWRETHQLTRCYLCHLATGGRVFEAVDLVLVDILLGAWERAEKSGRPS